MIIYIHWACACCYKQDLVFTQHLVAQLLMAWIIAPILPM